MMDIDLEREFDIAVDRLSRIGCVMPGNLCLYISGLGLQAIEPNGDLYQPADRGQLAVVVPVYAGPMPCFMRPVDDIPELTDLVTLYLTNPGRWWRRTGLAEYLGEHLIQAAVTWQRPLRVLETPFAWLNARGRGVCPLGADFSALRDPPGLRFDDVAFADRVEGALLRPFPIPRIFVKDPV
jgi:hypothetical protein